MSALGQKQTSEHDWIMSALPPKADIDRDAIHSCNERRLSSARGRQSLVARTRGARFGSVARRASTHADAIGASREADRPKVPALSQKWPLVRFWYVEYKGVRRGDVYPRCYPQCIMTKHLSHKVLTCLVKAGLAQW